VGQADIDQVALSLSLPAAIARSTAQTNAVD
jgi:hypothetical protein